MCQADDTAGCEDGVATADASALHPGSTGEALRRRVRDLEAALSGCLTGGNHLASALGRRLVGHEWPRPDVDPHDALETLGAGDTFDMWCAWRASMLASSVLASPIEEATSVADTDPAANKSASLTPQNLEAKAREIASRWENSQDPLLVKMLTGLILSALREERERAAKKADEVAKALAEAATATRDVMTANISDFAAAECYSIAAAIRGEDNG